MSSSTESKKSPEDSAGKSNEESSEKPKESKNSLDSKTDDSQSELKGTKNSESLQELEETRKVFLQEQDKLQEKVETTEKEQAIHARLIPCDSCELEDPFENLKPTCCFGMCPIPGKKYPKVFWIISAPSEETNEALTKLNEATLSKGMSLNYKFHIPNFKIGTLDQLLSLTDDLRKLDNSGDEIVRNLVQFMQSVVEDMEEKVKEMFLVYDLNIMTYVTRFTWNIAKYPVKRPIPAIAEMIRSRIQELETGFKTRSKDYNDLDHSLQKIEREQTGNLLTRSLVGIVKKEDFVLDSGFLKTIVVVVPKEAEKNWLKTYESLAEMVVPKSATKIYSDKTHMLYCVHLYRKNVGEFKKNAREIHCIVRDFEYNEDEMADEAHVQKMLANLKRSQIAILYRWIKVSFSEGFSAWLHVKALRVFVESVLRYGLELNYQSMVLIPMTTEARLRKVLNKLYKEKDSNLYAGFTEDIPGMLTNFEVAEYYPYVFYEMKTDLFRPKK